MSPSSPPAGGTPPASGTIPTPSLPSRLGQIGDVMQGNLSLNAGLMHVQWSGFLELQKRGTTLAQNTVNMRHQICKALAGAMEAYAKANAPWEDRTGKARRDLKGTYELESGANKSSAFISQTVVDDRGVAYGVFLETMQGGRFAIILPTLLYFVAHIEGIEKQAFEEGLI